MNSKYNFYSAFPGGRPVRLCEDTRAFAWESLHGKYGDEAMKTPAVAIDDITGFDSLDDYTKYDKCVRRIVETCPVRVTDNERVSGAATLGGAISCVLPVTRKNQYFFWGVSHLTIDFPCVLHSGMNGYSEEIAARLTDPSLTERQVRFLHSLQNTVESMRIWRDRYIDVLTDKKPEIADMLLRVPFEPAENFREAVQCLWFVFAYTRLLGVWSGFGRIDEMLGKYLEADLKKGRITYDEAREVLASFFIKGCEWIRGDDTPTGSGDAQHYQNIVLGGTDMNGHEVTNDVTYMVLDIVEELAIGDFPITVRINGKTPDKLLHRIGEVVRHGGGVIAVYNEDLILKSLEKFGYAPGEAVKFANDGCWEVQIPGKTMFTYCQFDSLQILTNATLKLNTDTPAHYDDFDTLYRDFAANLKATVDAICGGTLDGCVPGWRADGKGVWRQMFPTTATDLFEDGCIENARGYMEGGPKYTAIAPHIGGAPDVGNSLHAIDMLCFKEKKVSFDELMSILKANWEGNEALRQYVINKYTYYGNDDDTADAYVSRVLDDFADMCTEWGNKYPVWLPAGVSTFGRQLEWRPGRTAVPFGYRKGDILSGNDSPTPGTDVSGATAIIRSYCKADLSRQTTGAALDIKLYPGTVSGDSGPDAIASLIRGFRTLGGYFMQIDVTDAQVLLEAQKNPKEYKTLSVRVSGWNARFVTLDRQWQQMIIERDSQNI